LEDCHVGFKCFPSVVEAVLLLSYIVAIDTSSNQRCVAIGWLLKQEQFHLH